MAHPSTHRSAGPVTSAASAPDWHPWSDAWTRHIPVLTDRTDLTVKRPGTGIPAARLNDVVGRALTRPVKANSLLHPDDLIEVLTHARAVG